MTVKMIAAFLTGLVISAAFGAWLVPYLRKIKAGQQIRQDGPTWHGSKAGTPTMGGLMFIASAVVAGIGLGFPLFLEGDVTLLWVLLFSLLFGAVGFLDDYEKLRHKQNLGLKAKQKFLLQLVVAAVFILLMMQSGMVKASEKPGCVAVYIPFFQAEFALNKVLYVLFAAFVIVGTVNAVNITDGIDGLATGTSIPVFLFYSLLVFLWGEKYLGLGLFASAITGGLVGFLTYNYNPAKIFMGDTGSLFLGGAVAALAFAYDMPLILITLGIVFLLETLSDIIQVSYFKLTHGKRIFRMAPFHHHLEMGGWTGKQWKEKEIFFLYSFVSLAFAVLSLLGVINRF